MTHLLYKHFSLYNNCKHPVALFSVLVCVFCQCRPLISTLSHQTIIIHFVGFLNFLSLSPQIRLFHREIIGELERKTDMDVKYMTVSCCVFIIGGKAAYREDTT